MKLVFHLTYTMMHGSTKLKFKWKMISALQPRLRKTMIWKRKFSVMVFNVASKELSVENGKQVDDPVRVCGFQGGVSHIIISCDNTRPNVVGKRCLWSLQDTICGLPIIVYNIHMTFGRDMRWHSLFRHCATSWEATGSKPDGVIGIFHWLKNECQGYLLVNFNFVFPCIIV